MNKAKELLKNLYDELDWVLDDKIKFFKKSKDEDDEVHLSYLIWLRSEVKDYLKIKKTDKIIEEASKSVKH
ncbi:hypothetical protein HTVC202P_gp29 [Pelagibacter phage HTVC202P]|jgi:hypothetical protein|nr:hypothetical protein HTVC202P_gp29 [Pelagibacter phage HTVC202P]